MPAPPRGQVRDAVGGRDPLALDPADGAEAGRRPRHHDEHRHHADADRAIHAHLHRALRARPFHDARAGQSPRGGRVRATGSQRSSAAGLARGRGRCGRRGGRRAVGRRRRRPSARRRSPRRAAAAATPSRPRAPTPRSAPTSTAWPPTRRRRASPRHAYIKQSIVDPNAVDRIGIPVGRDADDLRQDALPGGAGRARRVSEREGSQVTSTVEHGAETQHGHPAPRRRGIFMRPGYLRALWVTPLFFLIGMYIVVGIRGARRLGPDVRLGVHRPHRRDGHRAARVPARHSACELSEHPIVVFDQLQVDVCGEFFEFVCRQAAPPSDEPNDGPDRVQIVKEYPGGKSSCRG